MKIKTIILSLFISSAFVACQPEDDNAATPSTDITGKWTCTETSKEFGKKAYTVNVEKVSDSELKFINFYQLGSQNAAKVIVSGSSLTIPAQDVSSHEISGKGTISSRTSLSLNYTAKDGSGTTDTITATYSK